KNAMLGVVEHERTHVVSRRRDGLPFEIAPDMRLSRGDDLVDRESVRALIAIAQQQLLLIPRRNQRRVALRQDDGTAIARLDRPVASYVIAMAVRVHQLCQGRVADAL